MTNGSLPSGSEKRSHQYIFDGSSAAQKAFGGRTVEADLAFLLPYLRAELRLVDFGCGGGGLTVQLSERLAPGVVVGFDQNDGAIEQAKQLAASAVNSNVKFLVASVYDAPLAEASFDVALFSGVLAHLKEPERALRHAVRLLKPGGIVAAAEPEKHGDWIAGKGWEAIREINQMLGDDIGAAGGDPYLGQRLKGLFKAAGLVDIKTVPRFSPALSSAPVIGSLFLHRLREQEFVSRVVSRGRYSTEQIQRMIGVVTAWIQDDSSIIGICECTALGWKP